MSKESVLVGINKDFVWERGGGQRGKRDGGWLADFVQSPEQLGLTQRKTGTTPDPSATAGDLFAGTSEHDYVFLGILS